MRCDACGWHRELAHFISNCFFHSFIFVGSLFGSFVGWSVGRLFGPFASSFILSHSHTLWGKGGHWGGVMYVIYRHGGLFSVIKSVKYIERRSVRLFLKTEPRRRCIEFLRISLLIVFIWNNQ